MFKGNHNAVVTTTVFPKNALCKNNFYFQFVEIFSIFEPRKFKVLWQKEPKEQQLLKEEE